MLRDLHILPKLRDSLSYIYVEHAIIQRYRHSVQFIDERGKTAIPAASLSVLLIGPGTSITHDAVKLLAQNGCSVVWTGEDTTRFYAQGTGETRKAARLFEQAKRVIDPATRQQVARAMYLFRFNEGLDPDLTLEQIRGHEGARVRDVYRHTSRKYGVKWRGRRYNRNSWGDADPINRALSLANALLNGVCHAAIVSGGYSPGLGFIHTGKLLSFVYDVADLYKTELTIPAAFETVALGEENLEVRLRRRCREMFKEAKLLQRILPDIDALMNMVEEPELDADYDSDGALPGPLIADIMDEEFEDEDEEDEDGE